MYFRVKVQASRYIGKCKPSDRSTISYWRRCQSSVRKRLEKFTCQINELRLIGGRHPCLDPPLKPIKFEFYKYKITKRRESHSAQLPSNFRAGPSAIWFSMDRHVSFPRHRHYVTETVGNQNVHCIHHSTSHLLCRTRTYPVSTRYSKCKFNKYGNLSVKVGKHSWIFAHFENRWFCDFVQFEVNDKCWQISKVRWSIHMAARNIIDGLGLYVRSYYDLCTTISEVLHLKYHTKNFQLHKMKM